MAAKGGEVSTASESYSKGNESFVNEDYAQAVELYTAALQTEPLYTDALVARAHALVKTEKFEEAIKAAEEEFEAINSMVKEGNKEDQVGSNHARYIRQRMQTKLIHGGYSKQVSIHVVGLVCATHEDQEAPPEAKIDEFESGVPCYWISTPLEEGSGQGW